MIMTLNYQILWVSLFYVSNMEKNVYGKICNHLK